MFTFILMIKWLCRTFQKKKNYIFKVVKNNLYNPYFFTSIEAKYLLHQSWYSSRSMSRFTGPTSSVLRTALFLQHSSLSRKWPARVLVRDFGALRLGWTVVMGAFESASMGTVTGEINLFSWRFFVKAYSYFHYSA